MYLLTHAKFKWSIRRHLAGVMQTIPSLSLMTSTITQSIERLTSDFLLELSSSID